MFRLKGEAAMRALGYSRNSKEDENSISLDYQRAEIERYCEREGLCLIGIEVDEGISGKSLKNRPGVQRLLAAIDNSEFECLVVFKSDRLSRDGMDSLRIENLLLRKGIKYFSVTEGSLANDGIDDEFMRYIRAGLNQRERKVIAMRTRYALARKRERGERIGGRPRYGWMVVNGELVPEPREREAISRAKALHEKGYSSREIIKALAAEGYQTRKGTTFSQTQIIKFLAA